MNAIKKFLYIPVLATAVISVMIFSGVVYLHAENITGIKTYKIGDKGPAGGWIFYDKGAYTDGWRYLEAAPENQSESAPWGCGHIEIKGAYGAAVGTGKNNTAAIIQKCTENGIAAKLCADYRGGGKADWFLPSKDELDLMYVNLQKAGIGNFAPHPYWSSTSGVDNSAYAELLIDGFQNNILKSNEYRVRAARAF